MCVRTRRIDIMLSGLSNQMIHAGLFFLAFAATELPAAGAEGPKTAQFPKVSGSNLEGKKYQLPGDFEGELNIAIVAFKREHQTNVDTWIPDAKKLCARFGNLRYYEIPTIYRGNPLFRWWLDTAMNSGIPDKKAREATITLYLDKPEFRAALDIPDEDSIHVFLVNKSGKVMWRGKGDCTPDLVKDLTRAVEKELGKK